MSPLEPGARWRRLVRQDWVRAAEGWERWEPTLLHSLAAVDPTLLRALELKPGLRVLDVGCGLGEPTLAIAQWVAPGGTVLGLDVSPTMLAVARRRARSRGVRNARFRAGDVARFDSGRARYDRVSSRFGLMFTDDPGRALANLHAALRRGGRIALAVWAGLDHNPSFRISAAAIAPLLEEPPPDPERSPHPMRFAKRARLPGLLRRVGFRGVRTADVPVSLVYAGLEEYAASILEISSPVRRIYLALGPAERRRVRERLMRAARPYLDGPLVRLPGLARVVSAVK